MSTNNNQNNINTPDNKTKPVNQLEPKNMIGPTKRIGIPGATPGGYPSYYNIQSLNFNDNGVIRRINFDNVKEQK